MSKRKAHRGDLPDNMPWRNWLLSPRRAPFVIRPRATADGKTEWREWGVAAGMYLAAAASACYISALIFIVDELLNGRGPRSQALISVGFGTWFVFGVGVALTLWWVCRVWHVRIMTVDRAEVVIRSSSFLGTHRASYPSKDVSAVIRPVSLLRRDGSERSRPWEGFALIVYAGDEALALCADRSRDTVCGYAEQLPRWLCDHLEEEPKELWGYLGPLM